MCIVQGSVNGAVLVFIIISVLMWSTLFPMLFRQDNVKLLKQLGRTKNLEFSKVIHTRVMVSNQSSQDIVHETNVLIDLYTKSEALGSSRHALMPWHFQNGSAIEVIRLFKSMISDHNESCRPNEYISGLVLSSCLNFGYLLLGKQCHGYLLKSGIVFNQYMKTALVRVYSMLSDVVGAMEVLFSNPGLIDTCTYNQILVGLVEKGYLDEALIILRRMLAEDMVWNEATYIDIFGLSARLKDINLGRQVHNKLLKSGVESDESVCSAMIDMYGKCQEILSARKVFDRFEPRRNVVIWTAMLAAYSEHGSFEKSMGLFLQMTHADVVPNESTFSVLLNATSELFSTRYGRLLHALAEKIGLIKGHKNVEDGLISMYSRTGDIKSAKKVFLDATYRDITTWNAMINGYGYHGLGNECLALFQEMLRLGEDPDSGTFIGVLSACGHLGLVEQGFYYLYEFMKQKGVEPGLEHYRCIINMLIKAGQLNEALSFIVSTPSKWDVFAWATLLSGCHAHRNYTLGTRVAELIPDDVVTKVNKWFGVTEVCELRDIKEESGLSWVKIKDRTHVCASVEKGDPKFAMCQDLMKFFYFTIRLFVDEHDRNFVEDEMKGGCDCYQGEEIAAVIALLNTEAPVCIIKSSGKISVRSHTLMKLFSKGTVRLITVRDAYHFHHFQDGYCSCADYW